MKRKLLAALMTVVVILGILPVAAMAFDAMAKGSFTDIDGAWYSDDARQYGYTDIFDDGSGKFRPNQEISRIEFVRLLHKALDIEINYFVAPDITKDFNDMKNTDIGAYALIDFVTTGIVTSGGSFRPNDPLDREVMVHWAIKALDYKTGGDYAVIKMMPAPFGDDKDIDPAYKNDIITAQLTQLILGRGDNLLFPKDGATRAEAVTITSRLVKLLESLKGTVVVTATANVNTIKNELEMSLILTNTTDKTVTLNHTSGQKYDFKLFDAKGENVYTWSADKMFMAALGTTEIKPGETVTFSDTLDLTSYPGLDTAVTMTAYIVGTSADFIIDENGYTATIVK